ncbi:spore maturation protein A [Caldanaerovirga acetigignens]|uniref:Spore maturation protein A n=1 Tax=Caldanaerovirga acetigignens TaxID=447595 RepID=A0A1M7FKS1_9FIRM|nr:nucleoside recognition domain-containing protein [Caldanaerovirga acetigignens]SHM04661.1 spore maturation protein A [Caldanaerovirga acetigignens]
MNWIFAFLILGGILAAAWNGKLDSITPAALEAAKTAIERAISLVGVVGFWLGIAKVAEESGLIDSISRFIAPLFRWLFPSIPKGHPAMGSILMNLSANMLGFGNAATPFGLKAMKELQTLNPNPDTATEAMCTFLAINTSSVTLVPATIIALRAAAGSKNPSEVLGAILFATTCSTMVAVIADCAFRLLYRKIERR